MTQDKLQPSLLQPALNVVVLSKKVQAFIIGHPTERYIVKNVVKVHIGNLDQQQPMKI